VHKVTYPGVLRRHRGQKESVLQDLTHEHASTHDEPLAFEQVKVGNDTPRERVFDHLLSRNKSTPHTRGVGLSPDAVRRGPAEESWAHLAIEGQELYIRDLEGLSAYRWK